MPPSRSVGQGVPRGAPPLRFSSVPGAPQAFRGRWRSSLHAGCFWWPPPTTPPPPTDDATADDAAAAAAAAAAESAPLALPLQAGTGLIELRRIEAARDIAGTLSKSRNVVYLPNNGPQMLLGMNPGQ